MLHDENENTSPPWTSGHKTSSEIPSDHNTSILPNKETLGDDEAEDAKSKQRKPKRKRKA